MRGQRSNSMQQFKYIHDGVEEIVYAERWGWSALFEDGSELKQFDESGVFHRVGEIDQEKLVLITLYKLSDHTHYISVKWEKGMRLVHGYRQHIRHYDDGRTEKTTIYRFGYKRAGRFWLNYVMPDDSIVLSDDIDPVFDI